MSGIRGGYDGWAAVYDHDANPLIGLEEPVVHDALGDVRGATALDLGCGTGCHALWLAAHGSAVTAVDFSEGMLAEARRYVGWPLLVVLTLGVLTRREERRTAISS